MLAPGCRDKDKPPLRGGFLEPCAASRGRSWSALSTRLEPATPSLPWRSRHNSDPRQMDKPAAQRRIASPGQAGGTGMSRHVRYPLSTRLPGRGRARTVRGPSQVPTRSCLRSRTSSSSTRPTGSGGELVSVPRRDAAAQGPPDPHRWRAPARQCRLPLGRRLLLRRRRSIDRQPLHVPPLLRGQFSDHGWILHPPSETIRIRAPFMSHPTALRQCRTSRRPPQRGS